MCANSGDVGYCADVASTLNAAFGSKLGLENQHIDSGAPLFVATAANAQQSLDAETETPIVPVAFDLNQITSPTNRSQPTPGLHHTLPATSCAPHLATRAAVRRLTPVECERLQGFPENWTQVPYRNKPAADGPRYKAIGNSWATNCAEWIGERIAIVDQWRDA